MSNPPLSERSKEELIADVLDEIAARLQQALPDENLDRLHSHVNEIWRRAYS